MAAINPLFKFSPPNSQVAYDSDIYPGEYVTLGYEFSTWIDRTVNALGFYLSPLNSSDPSSVSVTVWTQAGVEVFSITVSLPSGNVCASTEVDGFCWVNLPTPQILYANNPPEYYVIGATYSLAPSASGSVYGVIGYGQQPGQTLIMAPDIIIGGAVVSDIFSGSPVPVFPSISLPLNYESGVFGPNLSYVSSPPGPTGQLWPLGVPDPLPVKSSPLIRFSPSVSPTTYEQTLPFDATLGYDFALIKPRQVNKLGVYYPSGGFTSSITVSVWDDNPLSSPLISTTIPAGVCSSVIDGFCWVSVATTTLNAVSSGTVYRVGAYYVADPVSGSTDPFVVLYPLNSLQLSEAITSYNGGYSAYGNSYPTIPESSPNTASYFGPNVGFVPTPTGQLWPIGSIFPKESAINPLLRFNPLEPPGPYEEESYYVSTSVTVGYQFGIGVNKIVNKLGVYYPQGPSGFIHPVTIKLWSSDGTPVLLLTASIPAGPCSDVVDGFCWVSVPETTLISGPTSSLYRLGAFYEYDEVTGLNPFVSDYPLARLIVSESSTSYLGGYYAVGDTYPTTPGPLTTANYFGPNISFKKGPTGQIWPA